MILSKPTHNDFQSLSKWILPCISGFSVIFGEFKDDAITVMPEGSSVKKFIDGTEEITKTYAIQCYFSVAENFKIFTENDIGNSENITEFELAQSVNDWIVQQNTDGNLPIVNGWNTVSVAPTAKMPNFDGVADSGDLKLARYTIFLTVVYEG